MKLLFKSRGTKYYQEDLSPITKPFPANQPRLLSEIVEDIIATEVKCREICALINSCRGIIDAEDIWRNRLDEFLLGKSSSEKLEGFAIQITAYEQLQELLAEAARVKNVSLNLNLGNV